MKIELSFDENVPEELEGKTFTQLFDIVEKRNHEIIKKIKEKTGKSVYTKEVEKFLSADEIIYLRIAQEFYNWSHGNINFRATLK